jgi:hypothetical protein
VAALTGPAVSLSAQSAGTSTSTIGSSEYWLKYTGKLPVGSTIRVRTSDGKRLTAVLAVVDETGIIVEPKTRVPESPRHISFDQLRQVELKQNGMGAGKAAAIGVATGVASFLGILLVVFATSWD